MDKVLKLEVGMTADEVIAFFGRPDRTAVRTYGSKTDRSWQGLEYDYRFEGWTLHNVLVFSLTSDPPRRNHWDIEKTWN